jgi:LytS/YehU family sensor histidine kinase
MSDKDLVVFLSIASLTLLVLFIRVRILLKKQREIANGLVKKRDALIKERDVLINRLELEKLKFQITPHSLRNTLNVVKYFTETANLAIDRLTGVLDYSLYDSNADTISLQEEIKFAENFHKLMKIRTSDLVTKSFSEKVTTNPKSVSCLIPPMITAHFIENAYKHGELVQEGRIDIAFDIVNNELVYIVENTLRNGINPENEKGGIGLTNMRKRLDILFKDRYSLVTGPEGKIYRAVLKIKL